MASFSKHRIGVAGGLVVALLLGVLVGAVTRDDGADAQPVPAAAEQPVPLLTPVAFGDQRPSAEQIRQLVPPSAEAQADAVGAALEEDPGLADQLDGVDGPGDIDADDFALPPETAAGDVGRGPASGYVDGADLFGSHDAANREDGNDEDSPDGATADDEETDGSGDDDTSDDDTSDAPATTRPGGPDDTGVPDRGDDEPVGLVDICAGEEPPESCDGVGGTVTLASVAAFRFIVEPTITPFWPECGVDGEVGADEFVVKLYTNNLGDFTVRHRPAGTDHEFRQATGSSPEAWRAYRDGLDDAEEPAIVTCLVLERFGAAGSIEGSARSIELAITGEGDQDSGTASWVGTLDLSQLTPRRGRRAIAGVGRPLVRVEAVTASTLQVDVPVGRNELVDVVLVPRRADAVGDECVDPDPATAVRAQPAAVAAGPPGEDPTEPVWVNRTFWVTAAERGPHSACVEWRDDADPPRILETAAVPVEIAHLVRAELVFGGYEPTRGVAPQPDRVEVTGYVGAACGSSSVRSQDVVPRDNPYPVCSFDSVPSRIGVETAGDFPGGDATPYRSAIDVEGCELTGHWTADDLTCTRWYFMGVRTPDDLFAGYAVIGVRLTGWGSSDGVRIGSEVPLDTDPAESTAARLRWGQVSAEPDPADPSRTAIVRWTTDSPARVRLLLTPYSGDGGACETRVVHPAVELSTSDEVSVGRLCPGVQYTVGFDVYSPDGRIYYDLYADHADLPDDATRIVRSELLQMERLSIEIDYDVEFEMVTQDRINGVIPRVMSMGFGPHRRDYMQRYNYPCCYGTATVGTDCAVPAHFNWSRSGLDVDFRGRVVHPEGVRFDFTAWRSVEDNGGCPNFIQQVEDNRGELNFVCFADIRSLDLVEGSNDIGDMVAGSEAVFRATETFCPYWNHRYPGEAADDVFEVTVRVRIREV